MDHTGTVPIETERLILRRFNIKDAVIMYKNWASDPMVTKYLNWLPHESVFVTETVISSWVKNYDKENFYNWAVTLKKDANVIGSIGIVDHSEHNQYCEAGYCIGRGFWNFGYASEAMKAVAEYMLYDVKYNRVEAKYVVENSASGKVMEKTGMQYEGYMRERFFGNDGRLHDIAVRGVTKAGYVQQFMPSVTSFYNLSLINLTDGKIRLDLYETFGAVPERNKVPVYEFHIKDAVSDRLMGHIALRLGFNDELYYGGHIGYTVGEEFRNRGVATAACKILLPLIRLHGFRKVIITNNHTNAASRRVCEKLGCRLSRIARIPRWHELYQEGQRFLSIYEYTME